MNAKKKDDRLQFFATLVTAANLAATSSEFDPRGRQRSHFHNDYEVTDKIQQTGLSYDHHENVMKQVTMMQHGTWTHVRALRKVSWVHQGLLILLVFGVSQ